MTLPLPGSKLNNLSSHARCRLGHDPSDNIEAFAPVFARAEQEAHRLEESGLDLEEILSSC